MKARGEAVDWVRGWRVKDPTGQVMKYAADADQCDRQPP